MKVSVVITVLNEERTIERLLDSLVSQTRMPDEIIVVDGGSSDQTVEKLKDFCTSRLPARLEAAASAANRARQSAPKRARTKVRYYILERASIAAGRNFGIKQAKYPIIAMTDAGCVAHKDWLEKLARPFLTLKVRKAMGVDIVAGFYRMTGKSVFQRCLACYLGVLPEKLDLKNFLPSTRSIAFTKKIWEKVGGFDERLERAGEDTLFNFQAKKLGARFVTAPDALVDWEMPMSWGQAIKKFYWYAKGDAQTGIWWHPQKRLASHNLKMIAIFLRYLIGVLLFIVSFHWPILLWALGSGLGVYLIWSVAKNYRFVRRWQAVFVLPVMQAVSDLAVMGGFISGLLTRKVKISKPFGLS